MPADRLSLRRRAGRHPRARSAADARGFGLLEVMVALAIAALAFGVLFAVVSDALRADSLAAHTAEAVVRARSHLAMAMAEDAPVPGEQEGDDGSGFRWHVRIATVAQDPARAGSGQTQIATLYTVTVWITWSANAEVRLVSARVGTQPSAS